MWCYSSVSFSDGRVIFNRGDSLRFLVVVTPLLLFCPAAAIVPVTHRICQASLLLSYLTMNVSSLSFRATVNNYNKDGDLPIFTSLLELSCHGYLWSITMIPPWVSSLEDIGIPEVRYPPVSFPRRCRRYCNRTVYPWANRRRHHTSMANSSSRSFCSSYSNMLTNISKNILMLLDELIDHFVDKLTALSSIIAYLLLYALTLLILSMHLHQGKTLLDLGKSLPFFIRWTLLHCKGRRNTSFRKHYTRSRFRFQLNPSRIHITHMWFACVLLHFRCALRSSRSILSKR